MNHDIHDTGTETEQEMQSLAQFEAALSQSAPQPRAGFEEKLAGRLRDEYAQRGRGKQVLTAFQPRRYGRLSTRAAAVLVAILTVGIGAIIAMSAFLQQYLNYDAGLKAILEQGLGHEIGISQTIDGYTVTLEWAYADGNRLTLAYVIDGIRGVQYSNLESDVYRLSLRNSGTEIPSYQGRGIAVDQNGEPVGWGVTDTIVTFDRSLNIDTYDLSSIDFGGRQSLDLRLEVHPYGITWQQRTQVPLERLFQEAKEGPDGLFTFDFSIDLVNERRVFDTPVTAVDQDITIHLTEVNVAPSQTRVRICFASPDAARQWTAIPWLTTDAGEVPGGGSGGQPFMDGDLTCGDYTYFAAMYDYTGAWQLEITELVGFGSGGGSDQQRIAGSWRFAFVVP